MAVAGSAKQNDDESNIQTYFTFGISFDLCVSFGWHSHTHTNNSDKITRLSYINNHTRSFVVLFVPFSFSVDFEPFVISIHNDVLKKKNDEEENCGGIVYESGGIPISSPLFYHFHSIP